MKDGKGREQGLFLLAATAYRFDNEADAKGLRALSQGMGGAAAARLAEDAAYHELECLLHLAAGDCARLGHPLGLPPEVTAAWSLAHQRELARAAVIHHGAQRALKALAEAGVRAVPLKGYLLASRFYRRPGARPFRDLDLLVEAGSLASLNRALLEAGFSPRPERPSFVPAPAYTVYSLPLEGSDVAMEIDIHIGMHWPEEYARRTRFDAGDLWSQAFPAEVEGLPAWSLSPEHLVITTLLDAAVNHRFARLVKFRDALEVLRGTELDWGEVEAWCRRWEVRSFVGPGLHYLLAIDPGMAGGAPGREPLLPAYGTMRRFLASLPASSLPGHRSRSFSAANLLFFLLADTPRERARGLASIPGHLLRGRRRF